MKKTVYVLTEITPQEDYSERESYSIAEPATSVCGVYADERKALDEKERLEAASAADQEECGCDATYYKVTPFELL